MFEKPDLDYFLWAVQFKKKELTEDELTFLRSLHRMSYSENIKKFDLSPAQYMRCIEIGDKLFGKEFDIGKVKTGFAGWKKAGGHRKVDQGTFIR